MRDGLVGIYVEDEINRENIKGDMGCLGALVGYRARYCWKPEK